MLPCTGGRPRTNVDQYHSEICALYNEGLNAHQISEHLSNTYSVSISYRTLKRRFQDWGLNKRMPSHVADEVKARIQVLFFQVGLEDHDMLTVLRDEGFKIGKYTLVRLRFELGLKRRVRGVEAIQEPQKRRINSYEGWLRRSLKKVLLMIMDADTLLPIFGRMAILSHGTLYHSNTVNM